MSVIGWDNITGAIGEVQSDIIDLSQNKLDKSATANVVYANNASGVPTPITVADTPTVSTIPIRTTGGQLRVGAPVLTDAATPKAYVDPFNAAPTAGGTAPMSINYVFKFLLLSFYYFFKWLHYPFIKN